jgi:DivIVA domain-containing protein
VDDLLRRVAAELDAGRPAGPLIENATFKTSGRRAYDIDAVDWFLAQFARPAAGSELAGLSFDPWRDLAVTQVTRSEVSDPVKQPRKMREYFAQECANAWRNFGEHPGTYLRWERIRGRFLSSRWEFELRTADQQIIACLRGWPIYGPMTVSVGGRNFTVNSRAIPGGSTAESWPPGIAELAACSWRDQTGHYSTKTMQYIAQLEEARTVRELVDETGTPILHVSGTSYDHRAYARVTFPGQRWLRFLVRGTDRANAIMTAIDQDGNKVARYRITRRDRLNGVMVEAEIAVHPGQRLTDELILAIAISPPWLHHYLTDARGGGG